MTKRKLLILIVLAILCLGISIETASASDNSSNTPDLSLADESNANDLNAIEDSSSIDNLKKEDDESKSSLNQAQESEKDENLSISNDESSEIISVNINPTEEVVLSSDSGHTYYKNGYTFTVTANQYEQIKYVKQNKYDSPDEMDGHKVWFKVKTDKFYKIKKPLYKTKKSHQIQMEI